MRNRLSRTVLATAAVVALAVPVGAQAKQGADDPAGHVRHASQVTAVPAAATPAAPAAKRTATTPSRTRHRHRGLHGRHTEDHGQRRGRGADDATAERRGRGTDDGPNHS